jgi:hypothetical protein
MVDMSASGAIVIHRDLVVLSATVYAALIASPTTIMLATNAARIGGQVATAAAPVTVGSYLGTTQPVNFSGSGPSALVQADAVDKMVGPVAHI